MQNNSNNVCRICLQLAHGLKIDLITEVTRNMLDLLLISLDLDMSVDPSICGMCSDILDELYLFKSKCLYSEDIIRANFVGNLHVSLRDIFIETGNEPDVNIAEDKAVCRLCIELPTNDNYISLNKTGLKNYFSGDIMQNHLSEINLNIMEKSIICEPCHLLLKKYSSFVINCMDVERKIQLYGDHHNTGKGQVDLSCVLCFTENEVESINRESSVAKDLVRKQGFVSIKKEEIGDEEGIKQEDDFADSSVTELYVKSETVDIKFEDLIREELDDFVSLGACNNSVTSGSLKRKRQNRKSDSEESAPPRLDILEMEMYKCENCEYETRKKSSFDKHMLKHRDLKADRKFKCDKCSYETNLKSDLSKHNLIHRDRSEVEMHKCVKCDFETRHKRSMMPHMLRHHGPRAEKKFRCNNCSYETDFKSYLRKHHLIHKDISEVEMHKCVNCDFETRHKESMIQHMLKHRDFRAKRKFKCPYETNIKSHLGMHSLIHKEISEVEMHRCEKCDFETKYKHSMNRHMPKHRDPDPKAERIF